MKNKIVILCAFTILFCCAFSAGVPVTLAADAPTISILISAYEANSPSIAQVTSYYDSKSLEYSIKEEEINSFPPAALTDYQAAQNQLTLDLSRFYYSNKDSLIRKNKDQLIAGFMSTCLSTVVNAAQTAYFDSQITYCYTTYTIENTKLENGYSLASTVSVLKSQVDVARALYHGAQKDSVVLNARIAENTRLNDISVSIDIPSIHKDYNLSAVSSLFERNNMNISLLENNIASYTAYYNTLMLISDVSDLNLLQISTTIQNLEDQLNEASSETKIYAIQVYNNYQTAFGNMVVYKSQVDALNEKYDAVSKTYHLGKGIKLDVDKAYMNLKEASYNYYAQVKNIILYQYVLDNGVYGFSG